MLCYNLVVQLAGGIAIYYFKYVTGNEGLYPIFTTAAQFAEIAALFLFPILSNYFTKKQVFAIASFSPAIGLAGVVLCGFFAPQNMVIVAISGIFYKLGSGLTLGATTVMLADVIDYGQVKLGSRNESIIASFQTLLVKTASAVSAWLIGVGLTICRLCSKRRTERVYNHGNASINGCCTFCNYNPCICDLRKRLQTGRRISGRDHGKNKR